jgi:hypothetical protein
VARPPFRDDGNGAFRVQLRRIERDLLRRLPGQALAMMEDRHPATSRLFPVAYVDDPVAEAEYQQTVGASLLDGRRRSLDALAATADAQVLDVEQLHQWIDGLETLRLVLGTLLDVTEDAVAPPPGDTRAELFAVYQYLSALQDEAVTAATTALPEVADDLDDDPDDDPAGWELLTEGPVDGDPATDGGRLDRPGGDGPAGAPGGGAR